MVADKVSTLCLSSLRLGSWHGPDDIAVPRVGDGEGADPEVLAAGGAQLVVVAGVVVDASLGKHSVVLNLGLAKRWRVVRDDHQLRLSTPAEENCFKYHRGDGARGPQFIEKMFYSILRGLKHATILTSGFSGSACSRACTCRTS